MSEQTTRTRTAMLTYGVEQWIVDKNDVYSGIHALRMAIEYVESIQCNVGPLAAKLRSDIDTMKRSLERLTNCKKGEYRIGELEAPK